MADVQRAKDTATADAVLRSLPDDLPYKDSVRRVLIQAPTVDAGMNDDESEAR